MLDSYNEAMTAANIISAEAVKHVERITSENGQLHELMMHINGYFEGCEKPSIVISLDMSIAASHEAYEHTIKLIDDAFDGELMFVITQDF
jgi:hypothetical protein